MKFWIFWFGVMLIGRNLFGQSYPADRYFIPFLDKDSQSNVVVTVSDLFGSGKPCPQQYTNSLSNTNLFTPEDRAVIESAFSRYKNVTTNFGPLDTQLVILRNTNYVVKTGGRSSVVEKWVGTFQNTNTLEIDEITFGAGMSAKFRNKTNDGYDVSFARTGGGTTLLTIVEIKRNKPNGIAARFSDPFEQAVAWDYRSADINRSRLVEYKNYTNGMVFGNCLMWNAENGNLKLEAKFTEPYDWNRNYLQSQ